MIGSLLRLAMDADLYDQLNTTVTSPAQQHTQAGATSAPAQQHLVDASDTPDSEGTPSAPRQRTASTSLPQEIDQVVHAIAASPWAARLGSLVGNVRKQVQPHTYLPLSCRAKVSLRRPKRGQQRSLITFDPESLRLQLPSCLLLPMNHLSQKRPIPDASTALEMTYRRHPRG